MNDDDKDKDNKAIDNDSFSWTDYTVSDGEEYNATTYRIQNPSSESLDKAAEDKKDKEQE